MIQANEFENVIWKLWFFCSYLNVLNGTETTIFQDHQVNDMDADALAPCVARSSATMVLNLQHKQVIVFHKEWFQLHFDVKKR